MGVALKDEQVNSSNSKKNKRRRRKKRRTEDFSSDSSSSSEDDSDNNKDSDNVTTSQQDIENDKDNNNNITIDDINMHSDSEEASTKIQPLKIVDETRSKLQKIDINSQPSISLLTQQKMQSGFKNNQLNLEKISSKIESERDALANDYLSLMASTYSEDVDELRKKPDFTEKSLPLLAKLLKSGANIFDDETLKAVISK
ncbi:hypothetical protein PACTADRAFT_14664 [Pachysolen tannophilus NRRL Y-2460]|uniref:Ribosome assembly protein 3 n=1 Tax=Pachysolen tannophilus NRRL Y-2460 TaxID=669874 RepID=A0A1E4U2H1_PACTA|nr:hypothetical protein PACTADRAFT_14664 [Pachysolen tannophilus NRRL Y-2460]